MKAMQRWVLGITLLVSAAMAYFLQDAFLAVLIVPLSYIWYLLTLLYLSVAQTVVWFLLVGIVALIAFGSLYGKTRPTGLIDIKTVPEHGPIEKLAKHIASGKEGIYYKWLVANRLGKLAQSILLQRSGRQGSSGDPLESAGWDAPAEVKSYLISSLQSTFADFPRRKWFSPPPQTPFDLDVEEVVAYLESKLEDR